MTYAEAVAHLFSLGPELPLASGAAKPGEKAPRRKFDLAHMRALCHALGDPQQQVPSVLIAGTNGKGSTAATLASILTAAGYRTGLYTSPHLVKVNERIQLSSPAGPLTPISDDDFAQLYAQVNHASEMLLTEGRLPMLPSFFERVTAVAFLYFAQTQADIMVLEVGLGGRLDATNIVEPLLSVITDIALDHQEWLGDTIPEIAAEKCGILRRRGTLITLPQHPEANTAIGLAATALEVNAINAAQYIPPAERNTGPLSHSSHSLPNRHPERSLLRPLREAESKDPDDARAADTASQFPTADPLPRNHYTIPVDGELLEVDSPLPGHHQQRNLALAIAAAIALRNRNSYNIDSIRNQSGYNITNAAISEGIRNTAWPGRLEFVAPNLLLDVAHNPAGAWTLRGAIAALPEAQPRTLIFSCLRDKSLTEMSRILFPLFDSSGNSSTAGDPLRRHDHIVLAPIASPRAAKVEDLLAAAHALGIPAHAAPHLPGALAQARKVTPPGGLIIATGSVYLVGEIRQLALEVPGMSSVPEVPNTAPEAVAAPVESRQPPLALRWLTYLLLLPLIALSTAFFGALALICAIWDGSGFQQHAIARAWAQTLLWLSLSPVEVVGRERLDTSRPAVYASNHLSYYDTPLLFAKLPFQFRIFAKHSLWKAPFIGWYLRRSGQVPIDVNSGRSAVAGLLRGVKTLQAGLSIFVFPEGGRAATGRMSPFQSGAAFMAIKAQVPLVPLALIGTYEVLPIHVYHISPRPMKLVIGAPIDTVGLTARDAEAVTAQLFAAISELYAGACDSL